MLIIKFLKISLAILLISFVSNVVIVKAYPSPASTSYTFELVKNESQTTDYRTKTDYSRQKYENRDSFTWLTDPCTSCLITTKLLSEKLSLVGISTVMGETKYFPQNSGSTTDFRLNVWRTDVTLLTTYHSSTWHINNVS